MAKTQVRTGQIQDLNLQIEDLKEFGVVDAGGLNITVTAGRVRDDTTITNKNNQALALTDDATNFVEITTAGVASANTSAFTSGSIPIATVVTASADITSITDKRTWVSAGLQAPKGATYIVQTLDSVLTNEQALADLATGLMKSAATTGIVSIAAEGTDYWAPGGTDVAVADGGTGKSSYTSLSIPFLSDATTFGEILIGSALEVLRVNSGGTGYEFAAAGGGAFSDAGDPVVLNTTTKDVVIGAAQVASAKFSIDGDADQVQFAIQGHTTQSTRLFVIRTSGGTTVFSVPPANAASGSILVAGNNAGEVLTTATALTLYGNDAGKALTSSIRITAVGAGALGVATADAGQSSAFGAGALGACLGPNNTGVGRNAGGGITTGKDNISVGKDSGLEVTTGIFNCFLGTGATTTLNGVRDSIALGGSATTTASNQLVIGGSTTEITDAYLGNGVLETSPANTILNGSGGSGTNIAAADLKLAGGKATGNALGGSLILSTSVVGSTGATLQTLTDLFAVTGNQAILMGDQNDLTGLVNIDGRADEIQLVIRGHSTQTNNILLIENSAGTDKLAIDQEGIVDYQGTMANSSKDPSTTAPDDWVEIKINGITHFLPAFLA